MESRITKPQVKGETERIVNSRSRLIKDLMTQLARHLPTELDDQFVAAYVQDTMDLQEPEILAAFQRARRDCIYFPKIAEILTFAEEHKEESRRKNVERESRALLNRADKPAGWPDGPDDRQATIEQGRTYLAQLSEAVWKSAKDHNKMPSLRESLNAQTAERNGVTKVPSDPEDRADWASQQAAKMGWSDQRQPGDEV